MYSKRTEIKFVIKKVFEILAKIKTIQKFDHERWNDMYCKNLQYCVIYAQSHTRINLKYCWEVFHYLNYFILDF